MAAQSRSYLRGVDLVKLTDRYLLGEFSTLSEQIPIDEKIVRQQSSQLITVKEAIKVHPNEVQMVAGKKFVCIGHVVGESGRYSRIESEKTNFYCMNCLKKFQHEYWGIPIYRKEIDGIIRFFTVDIFCHPRCLLRVLNERSNNQIYAHSKSYMAEMFEARTGRKFIEITNLTPVSDPRLLKRLNGPMTWEEYHKLSETYTSKPSNIFSIPVVEYIEQDN